MPAAAVTAESAALGEAASPVWSAAAPHREHLFENSSAHVSWIWPPVCGAVLRRARDGFAQLADDLIAGQRTGGPQAVGFSGIARQQGTSTLVLTLAAVAAERSTEPTLLWDLNVERPALGVTLQLPSAGGLDPLIRGAARLERLLQTEPSGKLSLLPAPSSMEALAELLQSPPAWLNDVRRRFGLILVDLGAAAPHRGWGTVVDAVISVGRKPFGDPGESAVESAVVERWAAAGLCHLGVIQTFA
jgi:hypothetical protein